MKPLVCEMCNSQDVVKQDGVFVCQHCGTKYSVEEARKMIGTVKIDTTEKTKKIYQLARRARAEGNTESAAKYYEMILMEDPSNWEATFFSSYYSAMQTSIAGITSATHKIAMTATSAVLLIKNNLGNTEAAGCAMCEISEAVAAAASSMFTASLKHYREFSSTTNADKEKNERVAAIINMLFATGDIIESEFKDSPQFAELACLTWKLGFTCYESCTMEPPAQADQYVAKIRKYEPTYSCEKSFTSPSSGSGGCYIATAVYGSYDCPEVWTLRRFRDQVLAKSWLGTLFVKLYYRTSPTLVKYFGNTNVFQVFWRKNLNRLVSKLQESGIEATPYDDQQW